MNDLLMRFQEMVETYELGLNEEQNGKVEALVQQAFMEGASEALEDEEFASGVREMFHLS